MHPGHLPPYVLIVGSDDGQGVRDAGRRVFQELAKILPAKRVAYWIALGVKDEHGEFTTGFGGKQRQSREVFRRRTW